MGFIFDLLFGSSDDTNDDYQYYSYVDKKYNLRDDIINVPNKGKNMYCTCCRRIQKGGVKCKACGNWLIESGR